MARSKEPLDESRWESILVPMVGITITAAWAVSFIVGIFEPKYTAPAALQSLMMLVAGSVFALPIVRRAIHRD